MGQSTHSLLRAWAPRTARSWGGTLRASAERGATGLRGPFVPSVGRADPTTPARSEPRRGCCSRNRAEDAAVSGVVAMIARHPDAAHRHDLARDVAARDAGGAMRVVRATVQGLDE